MEKQLAPLSPRRPYGMRGPFHPTTELCCVSTVLKLHTCTSELLQDAMTASRHRFRARPLSSPAPLRLEAGCHASAPLLPLLLLSPQVMLLLQTLGARTGRRSIEAAMAATHTGKLPHSAVRSRQLGSSLRMTSSRLVVVSALCTCWPICIKIPPSLLFAATNIHRGQKGDTAAVEQR